MQKDLMRTDCIYLKHTRSGKLARLFIYMGLLHSTLTWAICSSMVILLPVLRLSH